jgi:hypothetical protein
LVESFDVLLAKNSLGCLREGPVEHISCIQHFFFCHFFEVAPNAGFKEVDFHLLLMLVLHRKPNVPLEVQFIHKFEQRTLLQQLVTYSVLNVRQHLEKLSIVYLWVTQDGSQ